MNRQTAAIAVLNFGFCFFLSISARAEPVIKTEKKPWGTDYTLVSSDSTGDVTLVSIRPERVKYASVMANMYSDDEYAVAVRAWDLRDEMIQENGELKVVVPGGRGFGKKKSELFIELRSITKIGEDVILVNVGFPRRQLGGKRGQGAPIQGGAPYDNGFPSGNAYPQGRNYEEFE